MAGRIEIPLRIKTNDKGDFWIGDFGKSKCVVDLSQLKFVLFERRNSDDDYTLILNDKFDQRRDNRNFNRPPQNDEE